MTPQEAAEESKKGVETMHRMHAISDFKKHFEKFRSEPFKSSLLYWIMTGTISGNFAITIDEFTKEMQMDGARAIDTANNIINKDKDQALSSALKEIAELHAKVNEMKDKLKQHLPEECIARYAEVKFCPIRNGDGWQCKECAND